MPLAELVGSAQLAPLDTSTPNRQVLQQSRLSLQPTKNKERCVRVRGGTLDRGLSVSTESCKGLHAQGPMHYPCCLLVTPQPRLHFLFQEVLCCGTAAVLGPSMAPAKHEAGTLNEEGPRALCRRRKSHWRAAAEAARARAAGRLQCVKHLLAHACERPTERAVQRADIWLQRCALAPATCAMPAAVEHRWSRLRF